jgi:hypothetical protein
MAALDRLDDLERFLLGLRPEDAFRPHRLWRLPLLGSHDYELPRTIDEHFGGLVELAREIAGADRELVVCATDVSDTDDSTPPETAELVYSSRTTPPEEFAQAILASAAISTLVLPMRIGDRLATDGAWTRNFPLGHAYAEPQVNAIAAFRYIPRYPRSDAERLGRLRRRLRPFERVPPVRALVAELREAEAREERGEPPHLIELIRRLMRITVAHNTVVEERSAREKDESIEELARLRADVDELVRVRGGRELAEAVGARFASARFPFGCDRRLPTIIVEADAGEHSLETGVRAPVAWTEDAKRALVARGYELTERALEAHGVALRAGRYAKV